MYILLFNLIWGWQLLLSYIARNRGGRFFLVAGSVVVAAVYSYSLSPDHVLYLDAFDLYGKTKFDLFFREINFIEPSFLILAKIFSRFHWDPFFIFLVFSCISVPLKIELISKYSFNILISFAVYFSYFFLIHDSTQIRASAAIAILYWGLLKLSQGKKKAFLGLLTLAAALFHVTSVAMLPMFFIYKRSSVKYIFLFVVFSVVFFLFNFKSIDIFSFILEKFGGSGVGLTKLQIYSNNISDGSAFDPLGAISIFSILFAFMAYQKIGIMRGFDVLCFNAFLISIAVSFLFYDFGVIQTRIRAMYSFGMVFIAPYAVSYMADTFRIGRKAGAILFFAAMFMAFNYFAVFKELLTGYIS